MIKYCQDKFSVLLKIQGQNDDFVYLISKNRPIAPSVVRNSQYIKPFEFQSEECIITYLIRYIKLKAQKLQRS